MFGSKLCVLSHDFSHEFLLFDRHGATVQACYKICGVFFSSAEMLSNTEKKHYFLLLNLSPWNIEHLTHHVRSPNITLFKCIDLTLVLPVGFSLILFYI